MANQISVNSGSGNITVTTSRSVIGTVANVASANVANTVLNNAQPNITSVGTLTNLAISGDISTVDSITLDTAATEAYATAKMWWDVADGTFNMGLYNNVTHHVGQQLYFYGKAVGNITKGQTVMFAGVQGDHILMSAADANSVGFKKEYLIGIAAQNVSNGSFGYVTWFGKIVDVDTRGYIAGSLLWFDPTTVGGLTNVEPTGNNIKVLMAAVIKAETSGPANNGVLLVRPTFEPALNDIQGVQVATPLDGQVLTYNSANGVWINANIVANVSNVAYAANAGNAVFANTAAIANIANIAYSVSGANVSGTVANATYATNAGNANFANTATVASSANSVTLSNVSGAGNIASINLDGSASNVLYGNGVFAPAATGNVANANYANFAGNAFSVDGGNVVGAVANATYAANAGYSTDGALANVANIAYYVDAGNINGTVANAAYADNAGNANIANIANIAYSVDGANVSGTVANATYAANAGFSDFANVADIANTAYEVDVANVTNIGNIATINLDGNASNLLDGTGNWVAIPAAANANFANFAGEVTNSAQPNITSVGTLTTLNANTNNAITVQSSNGNVIFRTTNTGNISGQRVAFEYINPVTNNLVALGADEAGFGYFIANTAPGNVIPGNIKSYWQFQSNGNLTHLLGGTGNINVKGATVTNNVNAGGTITAPNITANTGIFTGNAAGLTNIPGANVTGTVANANIANVAYSVDGANVSGTVANATFALDAGNANIANIAYSVDGANVSGTVANATFALDAGNANIANIAYSVDAANVVGLGNIAVINLDGNASNFLDGTGNFVAAPSGANANYANFAGTVLTNAQPNITSVGTLTALAANTTSAINLAASNSSVLLNVNNAANTAGIRVNMTYTNPVQQEVTSVGADDAGFAVFIGNTAVGNTFPANIKSYWQFLDNGNLQHTIGGTGAIVAKQGVFGSGNVSAGNVTASANVGANNVIVTQTIQGNTANVNNISSTSTLNLSTNGLTNAIQITGRQLTLNGANTGAGDISSVNLINGALNWTLDNTNFSGGTPFGMNRYNSGFLEPLNYLTQRGNQSSPADVQIGDAAYSERVQVRYNSATSSIFNGDVLVRSFSPSNTVAATYQISSYDDQANSVFQVNFGTSNFAGAVTAVSSSVANTQLNEFQETTYNIGTANGTITPDFNNGSIQEITLNGNITLNSLGNAVAGRSMTLIVKQDGSGGHTLSSTMLYAGGSKTLSTPANSIDIISMFYDGSTYYASLTKGYS